MAATAEPPPARHHRHPLLSDNGPASSQSGGSRAATRVYLDGKASQERAARGGACAWSPGPSEPHYVDIPPVGGRLVIFDSQRLLRGAADVQGPRGDHRVVPRARLVHQQS